MKKLNMGCGHDIKKGYINLDFIDNGGVDVIHNLNNFPYPFKDNYFDEIYYAHILEHVEDFNKTMLEIIRISKPNSILHIRVPFFANGRGFATFDHKRFFSFDTFDELITGIYGITLPIEVIHKRFNFTDPYRNPKLNMLMSWINIIPYQFYQRFFCWILAVHEVELIIKNKKKRNKQRLRGRRRRMIEVEKFMCAECVKMFKLQYPDIRVIRRLDRKGECEYCYKQDSISCILQKKFPEHRKSEVKNE